ncbi:hypothetical protein F4680DRAFT_337243 [Xylaria scruposa]|nr:hypothetical protein F4680DRAFT_337243 [Xylaria scruposa]
MLYVDDVSSYWLVYGAFCPIVVGRTRLVVRPLLTTYLLTYSLTSVIALWILCEGLSSALTSKPPPPASLPSKTPISRPRHALTSSPISVALPARRAITDRDHTGNAPAPARQRVCAVHQSASPPVTHSKGRKPHVYGECAQINKTTQTGH